MLELELDTSSGAPDDAHLPLLAKSTSQLFGYRPGLAYDDEGPQLAVELLAPDGTVLAEGAPPVVGGTVKVRVTATDLSAVATISAFVGSKDLELCERHWSRNALQRRPLGSPQ